MNGRFLIPFYLGVAILLAVLASPDMKPRMRVVSFVLIAVPMLANSAALTQAIVRPGEAVNVEPDLMICPTYLRDKTQRVSLDRYVLGAPPDFPWNPRNYDHAPATDIVACRALVR